MKNWKYINGAEVGNSLVLRDGKYIIEQLEQSSTDKYAEKYFGMKKGNYCLKNTKTGVVLGWYTTLDAAKKSMEKWKDDDRVWGNSKTGNALKYSNYSDAMSMWKQRDWSKTLAEKENGHSSPIREQIAIYKKDDTFYVMERQEASSKGMSDLEVFPIKRIKNSKTGNAIKNDENAKKAYDDYALNKKIGNSKFSSTSEQELKSWIRMNEQDIKDAERGLQKLPSYRPSDKSDYINRQERDFKIKIEEAKKAIKDMQDELAKRKTGNSDGVARMFEGLVKDENKETEKDSGAIEDLEKVGNAKDKNGKDLRIGDIVLVWTSSGERAGKVKAISGDRITVDIRNEGEWSTPGKLADKVSNSKVGNIQFAGDYYDIVQENPEEFYIYLNGGARRYGPYRTKAAAEIELKKILDRRNRIGNNSTVSEYNAEIQRLTKKAEQLRRMGQGRQAMEVEKQIEKLGKELSEIGNKSSWNSDRSIYAKWDEQKGRPSDEYARITWMGQGKGGVVNIWKGQSMTSEKFGSLDRKELERWAEQRIGNSEEYWKKQYIEAARKKGIPEDKIQEFVKKLEKEGAKGVMMPIKNSSSDDKFAYVMREFEEGKLKSSSGETVTNPEQAKAIAYSESKKTENGLARARKAIH